MSMNRKTSVTPVSPRTCQFPFADGRHYRMPFACSHPYLCYFHADRERRIAEKDCLESDRGQVAQLGTFSGQIKTANNLNVLFTHLWRFAAARRIPPRTAATLAYLGGLLLQTLYPVRREIKRVQGFDEWQRAILLSFPRPSPPPAQPQPQRDPSRTRQPYSLDSSSAPCR